MNQKNLIGSGTLLVLAGLGPVIPVLAQNVPEGESVLEEIVVRAERSDRSLRETASSVFVSTANDIERRAQASNNELLENIPNITTTEPGNNAPAVRGLDGTGAATGAGAFIAGSRPRLGYLVDGRTLSYNESVFSDASLWDVGQVEVYRGPQSTLQGRNSIAGLIAIRTAEPTFDWQGKARAIVGDQATRQYSAALSGPIVDNAVAFRLSGDYREGDSHIKISPFTGVNDPGRHEMKSFRGKLLVAPSSMPDMKTLITLSHVEGFEPQNTLVIRPFDEYRGDFSTPSAGRNARFEIKSDAAIIDTSWGLSDTISLQAVASAADIEVQRYVDPGRGTALVEAREYSFEPRLRASFLDNRIRGFVGAFIFRADQDERLDLSSQTPVAPMTFTDSTDTNAIFTEITIGLTPTLDATFAARYEEEKRLRRGGLSIFRVNFDETYEEFLPKVSLTWKASDDVTVGAVVGKGYNGGGAGFTFFPPFVTYTFDVEHVVNYELFSRTTFLDRRLAVSANLFYNDYTDLQLPFDLNPDPEVLANVIRNADKAESYGLEVGARFLPVPQVELSLDVGWLKTKVTKYPGSGIEGQELARSPSISGAVGITYTPIESVELSLFGRYSDSYYSDLPNLGTEVVDSFFIADARASYAFGKGKVFVAVDNIADEVTPSLLFSGDTRDEDVATLFEPRTVKAGVEFHF